ncbi:alginate regulatory protein [Sporosarcina sp. NCCP-2716]|uniref:MBOAT family O-acyltransferase n=1 Tax=Sporosarcina sp. NCCP-2716 TaxID=2943679 RepID=UPI00203B5D6D|nr:MBOAT family O-acyltransferase [Sporosarcina sp. NCCP-2716]GKV70172.1 alginate regulatory protein [Sporosarcina sp. NCCP-2716]
MVFSSLTFLFFFLPAVLVIYYISPRPLKNAVLLAVSLFFYAWGEPVYIVLMIFSAVADYAIGRFIGRYRDHRPALAKTGLIASLTVNLAVLSFFKYADFLVGIVNSSAGTGFQPLDLPLPIGISFYTFQTMSYAIDVYRGTVRPQRNIVTFALYVSLFPQLIAGPIVRYEEIERELMHRKTTVSQFAEGARIFTIGLGKKVLIANQAGQLWSSIQSQGFDELSVLSAWLGITAFGLQIYFDFSGYSDMAVGLGKMFGFEFPRNFNYPYIARSASEFWRRWHMTLGGWFRDYVYIPLGGSRRGKWVLYRNLFVVWGLTGLWHGASWNFVLWGLYFGALIAAERAGLLRFLDRLPRAVQHLYLLLAVLFSWVLFVFEDIRDGWQFARIMLGFGGRPFADSAFLYDAYTNGLLLAAAALLSTPLAARFWKQQAANSRLLRKESVQLAVQAVFLVVILMLATAYLVDDSFNPFLYFRF